MILQEHWIFLLLSGLVAFLDLTLSVIWNVSSLLFCEFCISLSCYIYYLLDPMSFCFLDLLGYNLPWWNRTFNYLLRKHLWQVHFENFESLNMALFTHKQLKVWLNVYFQVRNNFPSVFEGIFNLLFLVFKIFGRKSSPITVQNHVLYPHFLPPEYFWIFILSAVFRNFMTMCLDVYFLKIPLYWVLDGPFCFGDAYPSNMLHFLLLFNL